MSGETKDLGEQNVTVGQTTLITRDGPDGRVVVEVPWDTDEVTNGSLVEACVQPFIKILVLEKRLVGGRWVWDLVPRWVPVGQERCEVLEPVRP